MATLSPSIPIAIGAAESTTIVAVVHSASPRGGGPVTTITPNTPPSMSALVPFPGQRVDHVRVVGHQHERGTLER